jgi:hypothetical protein
MTLTISALVRSVALAGALLLLGVGATHLRAVGRLGATLRAHAVLPRAWCRPVAAVASLAEPAIGAGALLAASATWLSETVAFGAEALLFAVFTAYLSVVRKVRPLAPCGCSFSNLPVGWIVIARAAVLGGGAAGASVPAVSAVTRSLPLSGQALILLAAAGIATALWVVVEALAGQAWMARLGQGV